MVPVKYYREEDQGQVTVTSHKNMSKSRIYSIIALLLLLIVAGGLMYKSVTCRIDPLLVANIEALVRSEGDGQYVDCYERIVSDPSETVFYCGTCSEIPGRWKSGMSFCLD